MEKVLDGVHISTTTHYYTQKSYSPGVYNLKCGWVSSTTCYRHYYAKRLCEDIKSVDERYDDMKLWRLANRIEHIRDEA